MCIRDRQSDIVIFIKDDATDEQIQEMRDALEEMDQVQSVTYINKEQALVEYKQQLGDPTPVSYTHLRAG